jgi:acyl-CoA reductase-like NAD-dependent aldehyde dehydrogenase
MASHARAAQREWEAAGFDQRGRVLRRAQQWMLDNPERVIETVVSETGKTVEDAQLADLGYTMTALGFWAKHGPKYLADERVPSWNNPLAVGKKLVIRYAPIGVVGVIGPWNFPIANSFGDCIPALAAGNAVILKPSEVTPLSSLLMEEMMRECGLPEHVFSVATGDGSTGGALIDQVDCVMFTGSTKTGKAVMKAAAEALIPCYLELGGKDPMVVCADANIERAANAAAFYSLNNAGQVCISVERVYVEEPVYDEFVQKVADSVRGLRQGPPAGEGSVDVGAVIFPPQVETVDEHVRDAVEKGRGGGGTTGERLGVRAPGQRVDLRCQTRRGAGAADRGRRRVRQRRPGQLHRAEPADGGLEGLRTGDPPRSERDPQVHQGPIAVGNPSGAQARAVHVPVQAAPNAAVAACVQAAVRAAAACLSQSSTTTSHRPMRISPQRGSTTCCP